jgi:FkbM family methyltransferase
VATAEQTYQNDQPDQGSWAQPMMFRWGRQRTRHERGYARLSTFRKVSRPWCSGEGILFVLNKDFIKTQLQKAGLFPAVRTAYRHLDLTVRRQQSREMKFYSQVLKPSGLCFDIGANLGQRSEVFLKLGNQVVLLEPNPTCRPTLDFLFSRNPRIQIVASAVGSESGIIEFYTHGTDATGSALPDWDKNVFGIERTRQIHTVPMTTLDDLLKTYGIPDFVKIDVEGLELAVIVGLSRPLPLISFEFHCDDMEKTRACLRHLSAFGKISVRACSMDCGWLTPRMDSADECLSAIKASNANGDLFVWTN